MRELIEAGHDVVGADRSGRSAVRPDLRDDQAVRAIVALHRPDAVLHLAGYSHVGMSWKEPALCFDSNTANVLRIYSALTELCGPKARFLFVSSATVYGENPRVVLPINEDSATNPESPYALSKLAAEQALRILADKGGARVLIARPFNHTGPGQAESFACPRFARQVAEIAAGKRQEMTHGNLESRRDFVDVRDVVTAYRLMLEKAPAGSLYTVSSGESVQIRCIAEKLFQLAGIAPIMREDPSLWRPVDAPDLRGESRRIREELGWSPRYTLDQTLKDVLAFAKARVAAGE
jgi:GDP-4-dehydro-6-deoxy-D-mannose reductase